MAEQPALNNCELAWAAGFFDGEGCVRWRLEKQPRRKNRSRTYGSFTISLAQVHREPLDRFARIVGGGRVYGPYKQRHENSRPYFQYAIIGPAAVSAFERMRPFLCSIKSEQGAAALAKYYEQKSRPKLGNGISRKRELDLLSFANA